MVPAIFSGDLARFSAGRAPCRVAAESVQIDFQAGSEPPPGPRSRHCVECRPAWPGPPGICRRGSPADFRRSAGCQLRRWAPGTLAGAVQLGRTTEKNDSTGIEKEGPRGPYCPINGTPPGPRVLPGGGPKSRGCGEPKKRVLCKFLFWGFSLRTPRKMQKKIRIRRNT